MSVEGVIVRMGRLSDTKLSRKPYQEKSEILKLDMYGNQRIQGASRKNKMDTDSGEKISEHTFENHQKSSKTVEHAATATGSYIGAQKRKFRQPNEVENAPITHRESSLTDLPISPAKSKTPQADLGHVVVEKGSEHRDKAKAKTKNSSPASSPTSRRQRTLKGNSKIPNGKRLQKPTSEDLAAYLRVAEHHGIDSKWPNSTELVEPLPCDRMIGGEGVLARFSRFECIPLPKVSNAAILVQPPRKYLVRFAHIETLLYTHNLSRKTGLHIISGTWRPR